MQLPGFDTFLAELDLKQVDALASPMVPEAKNLILYHPDDPEGTQAALELRLRRARRCPMPALWRF